MVVKCRYCQHETVKDPDDFTAGELEYYVTCNYCGNKICVQRVDIKPPAQPRKNKAKRRKPTLKIPPEFLGAGLVAMLLAVVVVAIAVVPKEGLTMSSNQPNPPDDSINFDAAKAADDIVEQIASTPEGVAAIEYYGGKDVELTRFQKQFGISDRIAEAAIKEYEMTTGNLDYDLAHVKTICLRNARNGIPYDYLPESEK